MPPPASASILLWAEERGNEAVVNWPLHTGADVNVQGRAYGSALQVTSKEGREKAV
jgi:ankyrin repeat protein